MIGMHSGKVNWENMCGIVILKTLLTSICNYFFWIIFKKHGCFGPYNFLTQI